MRKSARARNGRPFTLTCVGLHNASSCRPPSSGRLPTSLTYTRHASKTFVRRACLLGRCQRGRPRLLLLRRAPPLYNTMAAHRAWRLRSRPVGALKDSDLELVTEPKPVPGEGQLLVKTLWASIDPTHRIWMSDKPQVCCAQVARPADSTAGAGVVPQLPASRSSSLVPPRARQTVHGAGFFE